MMELGTLGVWFGDVHTARDWELEWSSFSVDSPEVQTKYITVPGRKTKIDMTEKQYGHITYDNTKLTFGFWKTVHQKDYEDFRHEILAIHGQRLQVITDLDLNHYWVGRVSVSIAQTSYSMAEVTIAVDAEPYQYDILTDEERL
jgi:hypothetical protein